MRHGAPGGFMGPSSLTLEALSASDPSGDGPPPRVHASQKVITSAIVTGPALALGLAVWWLWGGVVNLTDVLIALALYVVTGFGITIGFHRLFTHRGFAPNRALKIVLAVAGSMAVEGSVTSWVATHRRHHMFSDQAGDPHSPHRYGSRGTAPLKGRAGPHGPAPPRDLVGQLALPHLRAPQRWHVRPQHQPVAPGRPVARRQLAQRAPRPPGVGPTRRAPRHGRPVGLDDPPLRAVGLGVPGPLAGSGR